MEQDLSTKNAMQTASTGSVQSSMVKPTLLRRQTQLEAEYASDGCFDRKARLGQKPSHKPPKTPCPLFFTVNFTCPNETKLDRWSFVYKSLVTEGPKSIVAVFEGRLLSDGLNQDDPKAPKQYFVVKYQLKYAHQEWSERVFNSIKKRYYNVNRGDNLCSRLKGSTRLCDFYGTFILLCLLNQGWSDSRSQYDDVDESLQEAWVIQIFEYIPGKDLYSFLIEKDNESRLETRVLLTLAKDITEGIHRLHRHGIYHGDLKPENVMVRKENGRYRAVLIDFDFASMVSDERLKRGTPRYLSPEYVASYRGEGYPLAKLSGWGREFDMWAIGAIFWCFIYAANGNRFYFTSYTTAQLKGEEGDARTGQAGKSLAALLNKDQYELHLKKYCQKSVFNVPNKLEILVKDLLAWHPDDRPGASRTYERLRDIFDDGERDNWCY